MIPVSIIIAYVATREVVRETWSAEDRLMPLISITGAGLLFFYFWAGTIRKIYFD